MGIELVAQDSCRDVFWSIIDEARLFAFTGRKHRKWWYLQCERIDLASLCITQGVTEDDWAENVNKENQ